MPLRAPCGGGSTLPTLCSALAELWGNTAPYQMGQIVRHRPNAASPWVLYSASGDHAAGGGSPSSGAPGWIALTAAPTQVPGWVSGTSYVVAAPVRVDGAGGSTRIFVASKPITSGNSPTTAAGVADGWVETIVAAPPPAPLFVPTLAYRAGDLAQSPAGSVWVATAAIPINPVAPGTVGADANWAEIGKSSTVTVSLIAAQQPTVAWPGGGPVEGDLVINRVDGLAWVYSVDPVNPTLFLWEQLPTAAPTVTIALIAGETPALNPPAAAASIGDMYVNRADGLFWVHAVDPNNAALTVWELIQPNARGTVTYVADTDPSAPFALPNNWGFGGTAVVAPSPTVIEPMPNDCWFNHVTGRMGIFT